ncbi:MAG: WD40 repeat domain-containing protein, partial [Abditibacteriaceae bacterium]
NGEKISRVVVAKDATRMALLNVLQDRKKGTAIMRPTSTLLQVSGFSQDSLANLKQVLEPYGLEPFIVPSSKKTGVASPKIQPGAAVGVQLVSGDMDQTAVGTITFRWGNRVLAFGHPMFGQGATSLPMTSAYVYDIFPSYQSSFKLASPINVVGAIQQDTQFAIGGTLHAKADTIPMRIKLVDATRQINKTLHVNVMNDPMLTPQLVMSVAQDAVQGTLGLTSDKMVDVSMRMDVEGAKPIIRNNLIYSAGVVSKAALADLMQSISLVQSNPFTRGTIRNISLDVRVLDGRNVALIKTITANRNKIKPGESLQVNVILQPVAFPTQRIKRSFSFTVPADAPAGVMRIVAASDANFWPMQVAVGGPAPDFTSLPELISAWNKVGPLNQLTVMASTPQHYLRIDQHDVQNPPPAWSKLLSSSTSTGVERYNRVDIQHSMLNYTIDGAKLLSIPVESAHKNNASTDNADDSGDDAQAAAAAAAPDTSTMDDSGDNSGDDGDGDGAPDQSVSPKNSFTPNGAKWNSTSNWNQSSWNEKLSVSAEPDQVVPGAPEAKPTPKDKDKNTTAAAVAAALKAAEAAATAAKTPALPTPSTIGSSKTLGRPALNWVDTGTAEFLKGEFSGAVVDSNGIVRPAPISKLLITTSLPFVWNIAGDNSKNVYFGSGEDNNAEVFRINAAGDKSLFFKTPGITITSLTVDVSNNVYAAVSPGGKIYKISPSGKSDLFFDSKQPFVWSLTWDGTHQLLIGTGGEHGELFRIPTDSKSTFDAKPLHIFKEGHVRAVSVAPDGTIYAGTGAAGVLYQVDPASGDATALYEVTAPGGNQNGEVLAVAASAKGVYFGTSVNGTLYRWTT